MREPPLDHAAVVAGTGRPEAPELTLTPLQELDGRGLAAIHRWYLRDITAIRHLMDEIAAGLADPARLAPAVRGMPIAQNLRLFGTACGRECQVLTTHHQIEDQHLFPALSRHADAGLQAVLDRLAAEHLVIHDLIEALAGAADRLAAAAAPDAFPACAEAFARLEAVVRSHFRYEETQIGPALGFHGIRV